MFVFASLFISLPLVAFCGTGSVWEYTGIHGPSHWHEEYPDCAGVMQSPVAISSEKATYDVSLLQFGFKGFSELVDANMTMKNNGHTVQVDIVDTSLRTHGGGVTGGYKPVQFHFHWGADNSKGSEHVIDNHHYPMEMHIVHYSDRFQKIEDAIDKPDGLLVLGFFFQIGPHNIHFAEVFNYLENVAHKDEIIEIPPVVMERLVPIDLIHYYRYRGSLTTPPCYESVVWTVFTQPIKISNEQMNDFRNKIKKTTVNDTNEEDLVDDFRPLQQLNGRNVYSSFLTQKSSTQAPSSQTVQSINVVCKHLHDDTNNAIITNLSLFLISISILTSGFTCGN
ncbi:CA [Mytilus coruscus]|uniref:Carbonic anhydrase n=1 Tax=Mytilus coruscus TaxID=42192 RepID=A0A6J8A4S7_MYTCO|nr:CA [Mytilus coruscus]